MEIIDSTGITEDNKVLGVELSNADLQAIKKLYKVFEEEKSVDEWNKCLEKLYLSSVR